MKLTPCLLAAWTLALGSNAWSATTNLIANASFESGAAGWILYGGASKYSLTNLAFNGSTSMMVANRNTFTNTPRQDVAAALSAAGNGLLWTTRFAVSVPSPTTARAWLEVAADDGSGPRTNRHLLAERVVRATNGWTRLSGTRRVEWQGALKNATFFTEVGMRQEPAAGGAAYPNCLLDDFNVKPDADGDGLWDEEEIPASSGGAGTNPVLRDTDGDGLPDGWEVARGLDPNASSDAAGDPDGDGFTCWEEWRGDSDPLDPTSFPGNPRRPGLTESAQAALKYLGRLPSKTSGRTLAGQHLTEIESEWANHIAGLHAKTGRWPGVVSFAAEVGANAAIQMDVVAPRALETWASGGLPLVKWQMANPWRAGGGLPPTGAENLPELANPFPALPADQAARSNYLAWRDVMADSLAGLRDAGVVVLFRPFSEMNGAWFWHGNKPRAHYVGLWRDLHAHLTDTRGLTNLLWVYEPDSSVHLATGSNTSGTPVDYYYPGDDVVDVVGHNCYDNDWILPFDSDAVWRGYGKIFAIPQAGSKDRRDGSWDNLTYLNGVTNSFPRLAFFCAWNTFPASGGAGKNINAISDNLHPAELMGHPLIATRQDVDWKHELPFALAVQPTAPGQFRVEWRGGILQFSDNLLQWTDLPNASQPHLPNPAANPAGFWRLRR